MRALGALKSTWDLTSRTPCVVLAQTEKTASNLKITVKYTQRMLKGMY